MLHGRHGVEALLQQVAELRLRHFEHHVLECAPFEVPLNDGPQTFDAVEFRAVRWHEKQFDLQVDCPLTIDQCPMRGSIVDHDVKLRVANEKASSQLVQKASESLATGRLFLGKHCSVEARTDRSKDSNAFAAVLPEYNAHWPTASRPGVRLLEPEVEAGFIEVNQHLLLLDELGDFDSKVILSQRTFLEGLVVHVRHLQIFDLMFLIEVFQRRPPKNHVVLEFDQAQALADREATPLLEHLITQQKLFQVLIDFALETFPAIHDATINVLPLPGQHPTVGAVHGLRSHE